MAAVLSHFARDEGLPLRLQLLTVPATDMRYCPLNPNGKVTSDYQSVVDLADMPWGPLARESWFLNYFIGEDPGMYQRHSKMCGGFLTLISYADKTSQ